MQTLVFWVGVVDFDGPGKAICACGFHLAGLTFIRFIDLLRQQDTVERVTRAQFQQQAAALQALKRELELKIGVFQTAPTTAASPMPAVKNSNTISARPVSSNR